MKEVIWNLLSKGTKRGGKSCLEIPSEVLIAIISFIGTAIGSIGGIMATSKLTTFRLDELSKKVDKHNQVIERTYSLERDVKTLFTISEGLREKDEKFEQTIAGIQNSLNEMKLELSEIRAKTDLIEKREISEK